MLIFNILDLFHNFAKTKVRRFVIFELYNDNLFLYL